MKKFFNNSSKSTIAGYIVAMFNGLIVLEVDHLDYTLPSTWLKLFGAIVLPIVGGHMTEIKHKNETNV